MKAFGKGLQVLAMLLLPLAMVMEITNGLSRHFGVSDLLFRRNSQSGRVECLSNKSEIELNLELHSHN